MGVSVTCDMSATITTRVDTINLACSPVLPADVACPVCDRTDRFVAVERGLLCTACSSGVTLAAMGPSARQAWERLWSHEGLNARERALSDRMETK
jgi:hypothetical protein